MSRTYYTKSGNYMCINEDAANFIDKLTLFLWDKIGTPCPMSSPDCAIVARKIRNYIAFQLRTRANDANLPFYYTELFGIKKESNKVLHWLNILASFFEQAWLEGGTISENVAPNKRFDWETRICFKG